MMKTTYSILLLIAQAGASFADPSKSNHYKKLTDALEVKLGDYYNALVDERGSSLEPPDLPKLDKIQLALENVQLNFQKLSDQNYTLKEDWRVIGAKSLLAKLNQDMAKTMLDIRSQRAKLNTSPVNEYYSSGAYKNGTAEKDLRSSLLKSYICEKIVTLRNNVIDDYKASTEPKEPLPADKDREYEGRLKYIIQKIKGIDDVFNKVDKPSSHTSAGLEDWLKASLEKSLGCEIRKIDFQVNEKEFDKKVHELVLKEYKQLLQKKSIAESEPKDESILKQIELKLSKLEKNYLTLSKEFEQAKEAVAKEVAAKEAAKAQNLPTKVIGEKVSNIDSQLQNLNTEQKRLVESAGMPPEALEREKILRLLQSVSSILGELIEKQKVNNEGVNPRLQQFAKLVNSATVVLSEADKEARKEEVVNDKLELPSSQVIAKAEKLAEQIKKGQQEKEMLEKVFEAQQGAPPPEALTKLIKTPGEAFAALRVVHAQLMASPFQAKHGGLIEAGEKLSEVLKVSDPCTAARKKARELAQQVRRIKGKINANLAKEGSPVRYYLAEGISAQALMGIYKLDEAYARVGRGLDPGEAFNKARLELRRINRDFSRLTLPALDVGVSKDQVPQTMEQLDTQLKLLQERYILTLTQLPEYGGRTFAELFGHVSSRLNSLQNDLDQVIVPPILAQLKADTLAILKNIIQNFGAIENDAAVQPIVALLAKTQLKAKKEAIDENTHQAHLATQRAVDAEARKEDVEKEIHTVEKATQKVKADIAEKEKELEAAKTKEMLLQREHEHDVEKLKREQEKAEELAKEAEAKKQETLERKHKMEEVQKKQKRFEELEDSWIKLKAAEILIKQEAVTYDRNFPKNLIAQSNYSQKIITALEGFKIIEEQKPFLEKAIAEAKDTHVG